MDVFGGVQETEEVNSRDDVVMDLMMSIREASVQEKCSFFNIVQKAVDPPLFRLNIMWWIFLKEFEQKCVNACCNNYRQNNT